MCSHRRRTSRHRFAPTADSLERAGSCSPGWRRRGRWWRWWWRQRRRAAAAAKDVAGAVGRRRSWRRRRAGRPRRWAWRTPLRWRRRRRWRRRAWRRRRRRRRRPRTEAGVAQRAGCAQRCARCSVPQSWRRRSRCAGGRRAARRWLPARSARAGRSGCCRSCHSIERRCQSHGPQRLWRRWRCPTSGAAASEYSDAATTAHVLAVRAVVEIVYGHAHHGRGGQYERASIALQPYARRLASRGPRAQHGRDVHVAPKQQQPAA